MSEKTPELIYMAKAPSKMLWAFAKTPKRLYELLPQLLLTACEFLEREGTRDTCSIGFCKRVVVPLGIPGVLVLHDDASGGSYYYRNFHTEGREVFQVEHGLSTRRLGSVVRHVTNEGDAGEWWGTPNASWWDAAPDSNRKSTIGPYKTERGIVQALIKTWEKK